MAFAALLWEIRYVVPLAESTHNELNLPVVLQSAQGLKTIAHIRVRHRVLCVFVVNLAFMPAAGHTNVPFLTGYESFCDDRQFAIACILTQIAPPINVRTIPPSLNP